MAEKMPPGMELMMLNRDRSTGRALGVHRVSAHMRGALGARAPRCQSMR